MSRTSVAAVLAAVALAGCGATAQSVGPSVSGPGTAAPTPGPTLSQPIPSDAAASPTAATGTFAWQRLAAIPTNNELVGMTASSAGYVALERRRTVWFSAAGKTWTKATLPFQTSTSSGILLDAWANAIVGGPSGFVAVGGYDHTPCTTDVGDGGPPACAVRPMAWSSSDGLTWHSSLSTPIPSDGSKLPAYSEFARAWPAAGGFDAAVEARDSVLYHGNTLLHSTDGRVWTRLAPGPLPEGRTPDDIYAHGGAATASGQRLLWQVQDWQSGTTTTLASSPDGRAWTPIAGFDGAGVSIALALGPRSGASGPWLLVGDLSGPTSSSTVAWLSDDLATWRSGSFLISEASSARVTAVVHLAGGHIAVGSWDPEGAQSIPVTWLSMDGTTWSEVASPEPEPTDGPIYMAVGPAGLIGVGSTGDPGSAIWLGADLEH
jgi:hypothetical protein